MADYPAEGSSNWAQPLKEYIDEVAATGGGELNADNITLGTVAEPRIDSAITRDTELAAEAALARNADNLTSGTVADARIPSTVARDAEVTAAVAAEALLARNADNLTSGTVADARVAATIARDSDVAAEAVLARNADNLTSGTVADARIAATIARDSEVTAAVAAEAVLARNADNLTSGTVADARVASTIARDSEVTAAVAAEATLARNADNLTSGTVADARIASTIARDSEVTAITDLKRNLRTARNPQSGTAYTLVLTDEDKLIDISNVSTHTLTVPENASVAFPLGTRIGIYRRGTGDVVVAPASGTVGIEAPGGQLSLPQRYDVAWLTKRLTDTWVLEVNPDLSSMATDAELAGAIGGLATVASTGDYDDLISAPTLPVSKDATKAALTEYTVTTVAADPDLILALPVGTFDVELLLMYDATSANDMKVQPTFSGTATIVGSAVYVRAAAAATVGTNLNYDSGSHNIAAIVGWGGTFPVAGGSGQGVALPFRLQARLVVTVAGNFGVSIGKQNNTDTGGGANATRALAGSYVSAVQVVTTP